MFMMMMNWDTLEGVSSKYKSDDSARENYKDSKTLNIGATIYVWIVSK